MIKIKELSKVIVINLLIIFALIGFLILTPATINYIYSSIYVKYKSINDDPRQFLPNYENHEWASDVFKEFHSIKVEYNDYYTWRRSDFNGKTINITDGKRLTIQSNTISDLDTNVLFFGGSTIWGSGLSDDYTIPSFFSQISKRKSYNYGETAFIARQSLAYLNDLYINKEVDNSKRNIIIFNDGANDIMLRCRTYVKKLETHRQKQIRSRLDGGDQSSLNFNHLLKPFIDLMTEFKNKAYLMYKSDLDTYDCDKNIEKAELIAQTLIDTWIQANKIAESNDDDFIAVLQPIIYLGSAKSEHLVEVMDLETDYIKKQFESVYPIVIQKISKLDNFNFIDFTSIYDHDSFMYIDCCHVGPEGSKLYAKKLFQYLKRLEVIN